MQLTSENSVSRSESEWEEIGRAAGASLRKAIWDPVSREIEGADVVLLVPDDALSLVSFAALPLEDERYLVDELV